MVSPAAESQSWEKMSRRLKTPAEIQKFLDEMGSDFEEDEEEDDDGNKSMDGKFYFSNNYQMTIL